MAVSPLEYMLRRLRQVAGASGDELGDGELLNRFIQQKDEAAFDLLVQRHGRMVLGVCRSFLHDPHDAEDAFQATYLVLVRSASQVRKQNSLSSWLYGVAYRTALKARAAAGRRRREEQVAAMHYLESSPPPSDRGDDRPVLAEELQRLPEKYRAPMLLCYMDGKTTEETAQKLGWPQGTVKVRLMRGRDLLRSRLLQRGLSLSAAGLPMLLAESASAAVPPTLVENTLRTALLGAAQPLAAGSLSASVTALAEGVLHAMLLAKFKRAAAMVLGFAVLVGAVGFTYQTLARDDQAPAVKLPDDFQATVLCWDLQRTDFPRHTEAPRLEVRADGSVTVRDPYGPGKQVEVKLSPAELQELLRFVIHGNGFFAIQQRKLPAERQARDMAGASYLLRIVADDREHELRYTDLRRAQDSAETKQLAAIEQRLERLVNWTYAGGKAGIEAALTLANEQLQQEFPEAPLLAADDLQAAFQRADGSAELTLERRGVAADLNPFSFVHARIEWPVGLAVQVEVKVNLFAAAGDAVEQRPQRPLRVDPPPIATDKTVKYDYDIIYVRAPRTVKGSDGKERQAQVWPNAAEPENLKASTDLMILHPDGSEEVLVAGAPGAIADPYVSFDAQWVYYSYFHDLSGHGGADVYKVHVKSRKTVRLTQQQWTPNTPGNAKTAPEGVYNMHPCPLPGGRVAFVSNRDGFKAPRGAQRSMQLFVMDDDGANVEKIGHLNVGQALHPVVLADGRIIFSSLEMQGKHNTGWGILGIHPDGTNWDPVVSGLSLGGAPIPFHFQTQLSDGSIVVENYYTPAMGGFGVYFKQPPRPPEGTPPFASAKTQNDPKMVMMSNAFLMPFKPYGMEVVTRFTHNHDSPSLRADPKDPKSPHTGWVTHPCGAPDNHLLTVWTGMMPANQGRIIDDKEPPMDAGIYLIKGGRSLWEPGDMLLVKNDPKYIEQWPRPLVPYRRIYGVDEPKKLQPLGNDGKLSKHLPEGTPFGLVGSSSLYKRESFPLGEVAPGSVTATGALYAPFPTREHRTNWDGQGADAGLYANSDIHAIRILAMEPPSLSTTGRFSNHAGERLRILGEFPVRKFAKEGKGEGGQPLDPDGNPDTSFLAKIPANVAWTFQTLDKDGLVLNMAQTWHQIRPGEIRHNCGGCHAHSQQPTHFKDTFAARADYEVFDLTKATPLLTTKKNDQSGKKWDVKDETGVRFAEGVMNVEYHRDIKPIFERSCVACHSGKLSKPAGNLILDDNDRPKEGRPGTYSTLIHAKDSKSAPIVWPSQSRNSLLTWKLFGKRIDGFPEKLVPGQSYQGYVNRGGVPWDGFRGSIMPPPEAVAGTYDGPDGQKIKVAPLSDEDRRTIFRWIDLGCPIDLDHGSKNPDRQGNGWLLDDQRPTLTLTYPQSGANTPLTRLLVGMHDYGTGLDLESFSVVADFPVDGLAAGDNLAAKFKPLQDSRWELTLPQPLTDLPTGTLKVSVKDKQGNVTRIERTFSVAPRAK